MTARIERLPLSSFRRRFIVQVSLGSWFDIFDIFMMAYLGAALQESHFLTLEEFSHVIVAGFLGMFVGTVIFGIGSDYFGRRTSFVAMLLIYSAFTLAGALSPNARALIVLRGLAGVGIDTYVSEMTPSSARGRYIAIRQLVGFTAIPAAAFLARILVPHAMADGRLALGGGCEGRHCARGWVLGSAYERGCPGRRSPGKGWQ